jgi:hypothetical protein
MERIEGYDPKVEVYKSACQRLGRYLDDLRHGSENAQKAKLRRRKVEEAVDLHGETSLFHTFREPYVRGYSLLSSTLRILGRADVHTNEDLVDFDEDDAFRCTVGFGIRHVELVDHMKGVVSAQQALEN